MLTTKVKTLTGAACQSADMDKDQLAENAKFARVRAGFTTEIEASRAIGCSRTLIISWENGTGSIKGSKYQMAAAMAYKVRPRWLTDGEGDDGYPFDYAALMDKLAVSSLPKTAEGKANQLASFLDFEEGMPAAARSPEIHESPRETTPGYVRFDLLEAKGGAGPGVVNADYPDVLREVEIAEWQLLKELGRIPSPRRVKLLTVRGNSMSPRIREGDVVFVDIEDTAPVDGAIFAVIIHDETLVKQIERRMDGLHIVSLAYPERPDIIPPDRMDALKIAGRVVGAMQLRKAADL